MLQVIEFYNDEERTVLEHKRTHEQLGLQPRDIGIFVQTRAGAFRIPDSLDSSSMQTCSCQHLCQHLCPQVLCVLLWPLQKVHPQESCWLPLTLQSTRQATARLLSQSPAPVLPLFKEGRQQCRSSGQL